jgi:hypothetical protein
MDGSSLVALIIPHSSYLVVALLQGWLHAIMSCMLSSEQHSQDVQASRHKTRRSLLAQRWEWAVLLVIGTFDVDLCSVACPLWCHTHRCGAPVVHPGVFMQLGTVFFFGLLHV